MNISKAHRKVGIDLDEIAHVAKTKLDCALVINTEPRNSDRHLEGRVFKRFCGNSQNCKPSDWSTRCRHTSDLGSGMSYDILMCL